MSRLMVTSNMFQARPHLLELLGQTWGVECSRANEGCSICSGRPKLGWLNLPGETGSDEALDRVVAPTSFQSGLIIA